MDYHWSQINNENQNKLFIPFEYIQSYYNNTNKLFIETKIKLNNIISSNNYNK